MASVAIDVGKSIVPKEKMDRYKKVCGTYMSNLEKNCLQVCDPTVDWGESRFRKGSYVIPAWVEAASSVMDKVTQENIHLYSQTEGDVAKSVTDPRSDVLSQVLKRKGTGGNLQKRLDEE